MAVTRMDNETIGNEVETSIPLQLLFQIMHGLREVGLALWNIQA
jgi:hypothetical protein